MSADSSPPGRNAPCPCGSGRKYKKCCLLAEQAAGNDLAPRLLNQCSEQATHALLAHARRVHGPSVMARAWQCFTASEEEVEWPHDDPYTPLFVPWALYHWLPDELGDPGKLHSAKTTAVRFLEEAGWKVDERTRRYIEAARLAPLTFWQVEAVEPGKGILLRDMATERECFTHERSASRNLVPADIIFGQVVELDGVRVIEAMGPYSLPPLRFRRTVEESLAPKVALLKSSSGESSVSPTQWLEYDLDFVDLYLACVERLLNPALPEVRNTDGDPLEWAASTYRFDPRERGRLIGRLEALRNIEPSEEQAEHVEFHWISQRRDGPVPLAHKARIEVRESALVTECNSRKRDRNLRKRLEGRLGDLLTHEDTAYQSLDLEELAAGSMKEDASEPSDSGPIDLEDLSPEAREQIEAMMAAQHMRWADLGVPALGGRTPRQAVRTARGKEEVERLIADFENAQSRDPDPQYRFDYNRLRGELGLQPA